MLKHLLKRVEINDVEKKTRPSYKIFKKYQLHVIQPSLNENEREIPVPFQQVGTQIFR